MYIINELGGFDCFTTFLLSSDSGFRNNTCKFIAWRVGNNNNFQNITCTQVFKFTQSHACYFILQGHMQVPAVWLGCLWPAVWLGPCGPGVTLPLIPFITIMLPLKFRHIWHITFVFFTAVNHSKSHHFDHGYENQWDTKSQNRIKQNLWKPQLRLARRTI